MGPRAVLLAVLTLALAAGCTGGQAPGPAPGPVRGPVQSSVRPTQAVQPDRTVNVGVPGSYQVVKHEQMFTEPARDRTGARVLVTWLRYPVVTRPGRGFPVLLFAPGFGQCGPPYSDLLQSWASAGYIVVTVNFPRTDCDAAAAGKADEADLVNQPADMRYVLTGLLALNARPESWLAGLIDPDRIAAAGHSDGGDTVVALAGNSCCADHRLRAVAVLAGAEWPPMPGRYFAGPGTPPPMMFVQGSADGINQPECSRLLYQADVAGTRYYLDLPGADHELPYWGTNPVEQKVAQVTLEFFDRYVLGQSSALAEMTRDGNVAGSAALVSGGELPPLTGAATCT